MPFKQSLLLPNTDPDKLICVWYCTYKLSFGKKDSLAVPTFPLNGIVNQKLYFENDATAPQLSYKY